MYCSYNTELKIIHKASEKLSFAVVMMCYMYVSML